MLDPGTIQRVELYFRTYLHTVMPLHRSLVEEMCGSPDLPLELATALEDIGQRYMDLADDLNRELIRRGQLNHEPDPEDSGEARIEEFLDSLMARAGGLPPFGGPCSKLVHRRSRDDGRASGRH
ncbi:hypothetical protein [Methylobacterium sp. J-090]|uniref:hypothetical protein n=1 Tax=Methylobacterium sp. J-090 TaxID=2836666 RepID=UPI001FB910C1|nr:hypothetical protein [Methylobacterium sp. J-090]MCJ2082071.1 hypothetical protein [Methylobacterium sp. J-090]